MNENNELETEYDTECRKKYELMVKHEPREPGYPPSELFSVMVVMNCDRVTAMKLIDNYGMDLNWSECSWTQMRDYFVGWSELMSDSK
jgi:hypothetical protein